jgi:hypothetical protein
MSAPFGGAAESDAHGYHVVMVAIRNSRHAGPQRLCFIIVTAFSRMRVTWSDASASCRAVRAAPHRPRSPQPSEPAQTIQKAQPHHVGAVLCPGPGAPEAADYAWRQKIAATHDLLPCRLLLGRLGHRSDRIITVIYIGSSRGAMITSCRLLQLSRYPEQPSRAVIHRLAVNCCRPRRPSAGSQLPAVNPVHDWLPGRVSGGRPIAMAFASRWRPAPSALRVAGPPALGLVPGCGLWPRVSGMILS